MNKLLIFATCLATFGLLYLNHSFINAKEDLTEFNELLINAEISISSYDDFIYRK